MAAKNKTKDIRLTRKIAKLQVVKTLESSLGDLQIALGKKKFERRIKQASRILINGLPKSTKGKPAKSKKIILPGQEKNASSHNGQHNIIKGTAVLKDQ